MNVKTTRHGVVRAGLHVHFSDIDEHTIVDKDNKVVKYHTSNQLDIPYIVYQLDKMFKEHILCSHRQPGIYEMKPWGFEYRSLPSTIDSSVLCEFIEFNLRWR